MFWLLCSIHRVLLVCNRIQFDARFLLSHFLFGPDSMNVELLLLILAWWNLGFSPFSKFRILRPFIELLHLFHLSRAHPILMMVMMMMMFIMLLLPFWCIAFVQRIIDASILWLHVTSRLIYLSLLLEHLLVSVVITRFIVTDWHIIFLFAMLRLWLQMGLSLATTHSLT